MKSLDCFSLNSLLLIPLAFVFSNCSGEGNSKKIDSKPIVLDTLRFTEKMRGQAGVKFKFHSKAFYNNFSRNKWVSFSVYGQGEMIHILKHSNVFVEGGDSTIHIRKISGFDFEIMVDSNFKGCYPFHDVKIISFSPIIQPQKGYVFDSYWLEKPLKYPAKTRVSLNHLKIE